METSESLFEILDFTAVSDWERTVSVLEEAIAEWDFTRPSRVSVPVPLPGRHSSVIWSSVGAQGSLSLSCTPGSSTTVGQQLAQLQSLFCSGNNGPVLESISCSANSVKSSVTAYQNLCFLPMTYATSTAPIVAFLTDLHRCTGLSELILLYPTDSGNHQSKKSDPSLDHLAVSALRVALSNCHASTPAFVLSTPTWKRVFTGIRLKEFASANSDGGDASTDTPVASQAEFFTTTSYMPHVIPSCSSLSDLLSLFSSRMLPKYNAPVSSPLDSPSSVPSQNVIYVKGALTYDLVQEGIPSPSPLVIKTKESSVGNYYAWIPFGSSLGNTTFLKQLLLETLYPTSLSTEYLSQFSSSPTSSNLPSSKLTSKQEWRLSVHFKENQDLLGTAALTRLLQSWLTSCKQIPPGLVDQHDLFHALKWMFSDALELDSPSQEQPSMGSGSLLNIPSPFLKQHCIPRDSLLHKLSLRLLDAASPHPKWLHFDCAFLSFVKGLWADFLKVLKVCWEEGLDVPHLQTTIDFRACLLHQKLCLLQTCIREKRKRQTTHSQYVRITDHPMLQNPEYWQSPSPSSQPLSATLDKSSPLTTYPKSLVETLADMAVSAVVGPPSPPRGSASKYAVSHLTESYILPDKPDTAKSWQSEHSWIELSKPHERHISRPNESGAVDLWGDEVKPNILFEHTDEESPKHDKFEESFEDFPATFDDQHSLGMETVPSETAPLKEPQGRHAPLGSLCSLATGLPLWIPDTQEPVSLTEDLLQAQQDTLESLGTSKEAAKARAKLQCEHLLSDMSAFKAANPWCQLADFVRWHSPRDWIDGEQAIDQEGRLSDRMCEPGNLWQELWDAAAPIPVTEQKCLLDYDSTAQSVFEFLEKFPVHSLLQSLLPMFFGAFYDRITNDPTASEYPVILKLLKQFSDKWDLIDWKLVDDISFLEGLASDVRSMEEFLSKAKSLECKFPGQFQFIARLIESPQWITRDAERMCILELMKSKCQSLSLSSLEPICTEYIFQSDKEVLDGVLGLVRIPQRLYVKMRDGEFRLMETVGRTAA